MTMRVQLQARFAINIEGEERTNRVGKTNPSSYRMDGSERIAYLLGSTSLRRRVTGNSGSRGCTELFSLNADLVDSDLFDSEQAS